jgi:stringent starvation protein B
MSTIKSEFFQQSMARSPTSITTLFVHPLCPGVVLPPHLMSQGVVKLNFAYAYVSFFVEWDEAELRATLSFNGVPQSIVLPWESIGVIENEEFALVSRQPITSKPVVKKRFVVVKPKAHEEETIDTSFQGTFPPVSEARAVPNLAAVPWTESSLHELPQARAVDMRPSMSPQNLVHAEEEAVQAHKEQSPVRVSNRPSLRLVKEDEYPLTD